MCAKGSWRGASYRFELSHSALIMGSKLLSKIGTVFHGGHGIGFEDLEDRADHVKGAFILGLRDVADCVFMSVVCM
eukprot:1388952-Amorphochlora_amoeboformis.AAC.2